MTPEDKKSTRGAEWIAIGLTLGAGIGIVTDNLAIGAGIGLLIGVLIMMIMQKRV